MSTNQHLAGLLAMPQADFDHYFESVRQVAMLRGRIEPAVAMAGADYDTPEPPPAEAVKPRETAARLAYRPPMRAPKPGTLRAAIHDVLRAGGKPMRRAEIIAAAAQHLDRKIDGKLRAKVGDLLTNPHDPSIRRVSYGVYALAGEQKLIAAWPGQA